MKKEIVRGQPWSEKEEALLGTLTDRALAERLGRSEHAVCVKRLKMGIAPFDNSRKKRALPRRLAKLIGKIGDAELARLAGCTRKHIHALRTGRTK